MLHFFKRRAVPWREKKQHWFAHRSLSSFLLISKGLELRWGSEGDEARGKEDTVGDIVGGDITGTGSKAGSEAQSIHSVVWAT